MKDMAFNILIGEDVRRDDCDYIYREAVRAIIFDGRNLLMLQNNKGDYKFPGGGVELGESYEQALNREVEEETGYQLLNIVKELGVTIERRVDSYEEEKGFEMKSTYYLCNLSDSYIGQNLTKSELALEFATKWIDIEDAFKHNLLLLTTKKDTNPWLAREIKVLEYLKNNFQKL